MSKDCFFIPLPAETFSLLIRMRILIRNEFGTAPTLHGDDVIEKYYKYGTQSQQPDLIQLTAQLALLIPHPLVKSIEPEPSANTQPGPYGDTQPETSAATAVGFLIRMRPFVRKEFGVTPPLQGKDAIEKYYIYGKQSRQPELRKLAQDLEAFVSRPGTTHAAAAPVFMSPAMFASAPPAAPAKPDPSASRLGASAEAPPAATAFALSEHDSILELFVSDLASQPVQLLCHAVPPFILDKPRQRCLLNSLFQGLLPLQNVGRNAVRVEPVSPETVAAFEKRANIVPLEAFLWFCGTQLSHGTLLPSLRTRQGFHLNKWPDFGKLPYTREHMRLATLLQKAPHALTNLINNAGVPHAETVAFLNAAFLCGWLQEAVVAPETTGVPSASSTERRGIISRIRERLGLTR